MEHQDEPTITESRPHSSIRRLGWIGILIAVVTLFAVIMSEFYCAFPWAMVCRWTGSQ